MRRTVLTLVMIAIATTLGVGSAGLRIASAVSDGGLRNGAWMTREQTGSAAADATTRAAVAVSGLLALSRDETIYFTAFTDSDGEALTSRCRYRVHGRALPARWWSITAYGADHFLIPNPARRYSYTMSNLEPEPDGSFALAVGGVATDRNPLPVAESTANAPFSLTLRLYGPSAAANDAPAEIELPGIERGTCG